MSEGSDAKAVKEAEAAYAAAAAETPVAVEPVAVEVEAAPAKVEEVRAVPVAPVAAVAATPKKARSPRKAAKRKPAQIKHKPAEIAPKPARKKSITRKISRPEAAAKATSSKPQPTVQELKEKIMATAKKTPEYTNILKTAQTKAKEAYAKSTAVAAEVGTFSKGNVEAVVASGKILGEGVKAISQAYVAESKNAFETLTGDLKALAAVKSPTELFQLQGQLARRNFDQAVAYGSKTSESLVKLANEVFAPISNRVSLAVDKISKAA